MCRILSFPINKRNNIYKRVRQAVRLGQPASFFAWNIALGDILTILMTQENVLIMYNKLRKLENA